MKKFVTMAVALTMALGLVACTSKSDDAQTAPETEEVQAEVTEEAEAETAEATDERTTFTVGFDAEFPPYGFLDEATGEYVGFDLDLAAEVCARNGWELVKQPIDWDAKDMELSSGAIDCI